MNERDSQAGVDLAGEMPDEQDATDAITRNVIDTLTRVARKKILFAKAMGVSVLAGLIVCVALPVRYTAITTIMPPKQTQSTTSFLNSQMGSLAEAAGVGLLKDPNAIYVGLLKSRPVADSIITRFGLMKVYRSRDMTGARKELESNTEIVSEKSTLISISVTDRDGARAATLANAYTDELRILSKNISVTEASRRRLFFEDQLKSQRETLIGAEVAFQQVQLNKGLVRLDSQANVIISGLAMLRGQIAAKEVELQALRSYSTEHNPDVQLAERELSTMQGESTQMAQGTGPSDYSDMSLKDVPKAGLDYIRAQRELQYQQSVFDLLLRQYEAARLDEAKEAAVIQVVEPAIQPDRKSSPQRLEILLLSVLIGLLLGYAAVQVRYRMEVALSDPERAEALHGLRRTLFGESFSPARSGANG
jgi:tyrosine-protein kinase Etk/Wzc